MSPDFHSKTIMDLKRINCGGVIMIFVTKVGEVADCRPSPSCPPPLPSLLILTQGLLLMIKLAKPLGCYWNGPDDLDDNTHPSHQLRQLTSLAWSQPGTPRFL